MKVSEDFVCEHGMPRPWVTCTDCMYLPAAERPEPPAPPVRTARRGQMPKTAADPIPEFVGDKDMSTAVHEVAPHVEGPGNDWLFPNKEGFPWNLRPGGWIYLRHDGRLHARVRVRAIGFRESRPYHTGTGDAGPGPSLEVDRGTWQWFDHDLGDLADSQIQGYRYLITLAGGETLVHLSADEPVPHGIEVDPPVSPDGP